MLRGKLVAWNCSLTGRPTSVECRRRPSWRCSGSTRRSGSSSCSARSASARRPPSSTCDRGRWRRRSGSGRGAGRTPPSCSWRRTSAASARARSERGTAGCCVTSAAWSRWWRSAGEETEPCSPPVCAGPRSTAHSPSIVTRSSTRQWRHWLQIRAALPAMAAKHGHGPHLPAIKLHESWGLNSNRMLMVVSLC